MLTLFSNEEKFEEGEQVCLKLM